MGYAKFPLSRKPSSLKFKKPVIFFLFQKIKVSIHKMRTDLPRCYGLTNRGTILEMWLFSVCRKAVLINYCSSSAFASLFFDCFIRLDSLRMGFDIKVVVF